MRLNLKTEMKRNGYTIDDLANAIDVHRNTMANKLDRIAPFHFDEAQMLKEKLFPYADLQYLFKNYPDQKGA